jgi:hypothetical protein
MDVTDKSAGPDIVGRIMALEQKTRGLYGRVSALEMRFSSGEAAAYDDTEFVSGERRRELSLEGRITALEAALEEKRRASNAQKVSVLDVTGVVVGFSLLAVGALLATGSIDLLRNPLLAFTAGIVILACAAGRLVLK